MTINPQVSEVTYLGNNVTTSFTFPFVGVAASDIKVIYTDELDNQTLINPSLYTLTLNPVAPGSLWGVGGTVVYPNAGSPIATGTSLTILRSVPYAQTVSISNQGAFYPQVVEQALDLLELQIQQLYTSIVDLTTRVSTLESDVVTINSEITTLQGDINTINSEINSINSSISGLNSDINTINSDLSGIHVDLNTLFSNDATLFALVQALSSPSGTYFSTPRQVSTTGTATINLVSTDSFNGISLYQTGPAATSVQIPAGTGPFTVWDGSLNCSSYPITILPPAGKTIMGQASYTMFTNGQSATFYNDGAQILIG